VIAITAFEFPKHYAVSGLNRPDGRYRRRGWYRSHWTRRPDNEILGSLFDHQPDPGV